MKKVTIDDIAKKAGVSKGTVSAVINQKSTVKPKTRDHVIGVMKSLNYRPKNYSRLVKNNSEVKSIGLIIKDINYPFYTAIASGAKEYANSKGYSLFIASSQNSHESEKELSHLFVSKDIKGAIIAPVVEGAAEIEHLFKLKMMNYPFVLLEDVRGIHANVVTIENMLAIKKAVDYLIESGHKRIVHFSGPASSTHSEERIEGFKRAFSEHALKFKKNMVVEIGSDHEESYMRTKDYFLQLDKKDYPTAVVCFNDLQALAVIMALNELKICVPEDVSIIGNDDIYYAQIYPVPLTTLRAPQIEIGRKAAEILIQNIEANKPLANQRVSFDSKLIIRESTKMNTTRGARHTDALSSSTAHEYY
ncbi:LacI family DNA-binding transcriptional regulator [candidate division KSB1 bacterium]|nr:LacI family DNA-binding transcriptional regulator [candidate division KSB1 bacterium]